MAILYRTDHLLKEPPSLFLGHPAFSLLDNVIEQLFPSVLHDHNDVGRRGDYFVPTIRHVLGVDSQFNDMRMPQDLEILNLSLDTRIHISSGDFGTVDEFQRDLMPCNSMRRDYTSAWSNPDSRLTLPKLPVPRVRSIMYCPILFF